ncbi:phosphotransferase family protein [Streptomyces sp. NPDC051976]|uniref:phosphotransferase family protein n=1 Tax=Streptomyces sp. NPDC051976 TaxID=3154947 RepID=UPI00342D84A3
MTDAGHQLAIKALLGRAGLRAEGRLAIRRLSNGQSNLTFLIESESGRKWVARRPPLGTILESAHDVDREARIMRALAETDVPVPTVLAQLRSDHVPWVLLGHIEGTVVEDVHVARGLSAAHRHGLGPRLAQRLAGIHAVDLGGTGLLDLSSRAPYAQRQLRRWTRQWEESRTRPLPSLEKLTARLVEGAVRLRPQESSVLVHGDFHLRNVIVQDAEVVGVLDWELSTLGHPLADLGTLLAYWPMPGEMPSADDSPSLAPGWASRADLVEAYAQASGTAVDDYPYWHSLGLWKVAIIAEGVRRRVLDHPQNEAAGGAPTAEVINALVARAHDAVTAWGN